MEKAIYVITGVMAAGKSTVAEALSKKLEKCVHLHGDVFRKMIVSGREEMSDNPSEEALNQLNIRYRITANVAKEYYDNGFTVVVQDNYLGDKLTYFTELLRNYQVYVIVLCPSIKTIEQREKNRGKKGYIGFTVDSLYGSFMESTPRIGLWLDTSNMSPEETVNEIIRRADKEGKYR
ncbi:AAA family ATPase [Clostridium sp. CX1]|uniref:AAA family ATPase n=1 Tax=Clostridium tanneri TaxID=3037988 RepID=A0ABU4JPY7_9CLOT|nr:MULTISPECIES: AAA family ATPase [unclassified Clostridium]MCT8975299.1 AAA family ATPase [Clostridium sp. CX1]MDW8800222.1 AAA family ATPase [Clostridium sp. A1-XYC3]